MPDMNMPAEGGATSAHAAEAEPVARGAPGFRVLAHPGFVLWSFTATTFLSALLLFSVQPMFAKMVLPVLGGSPSVWAVADLLLPGRAARRLLLRALADRARADSHRPALIHLARLPAGVPGAADRAARGLERAADGGALSVADRAFHGGRSACRSWPSRPTHRCCRRGSRVPAIRTEMIPISSMRRAISAVSLRCSAIRSSSSQRSGLKAAEPAVDRWVSCAGCGLGLVFVVMRTCQTATGSSAPGVSGAGNDRRSRTAEVDRPPGLDRSGPGTCRFAHGLHDARDDRCRLRASALGAAARPLSAHFRSGVSRQAVYPAHRAAAISILRRWSSPCLRSRRPSTRTGSYGASTGVAVFFTSAMVAHRTLYEARPAARYLTEFYLWMSFGGALGGLAAALIAPKIFSEVFEYPLLLALSMACRPGVFDLAMRCDGSAASDRLRSRRVRRCPVAGAATRDDRARQAGDAGALADRRRRHSGDLLAAVGHRPSSGSTSANGAPRVVVVAAPRAAAGRQLRRPPRQLVAALLVFCALVWLPSAVKRGEAQRSYFGVYRVQTLGRRRLPHADPRHDAARRTARARRGGQPRR